MGQPKPQPTERLQSRRMFVACTLSAILFLPLAACTNRPSEDSESTVPRSIDGRSADEYLKSVFLRYQSARSYRDNGTVRLTYQRNGQQAVEEARFRVWLDRNLLYVEAYDVRLRCDQGDVLAWLVDPATDNHDSQVLAFRIDRGRPQLSQLVLDEVLDQKLTVGLAGPPPQLEWLFAQEPMKHMFDGDCTISFQPQRILNQRPCNVVTVTQDSDQYRFWIDAKSSVIHRVDLPEILLSPEPFSRVQTGSSDASFSLSVHLDDATFEVPQEQPAAAPLPSSPKFVGRFVPLPPPKPPRLLGSTPRFAIRDQSGSIRFVDGRTDRAVTVVAGLSKDQANDQLYFFDQWTRMMPAKFAERVRNLVVTDHDIFNRLTSAIQIPVVVDQSGEVSKQLQLAEYQVVVLDSSGRVCWLQANLSTQPSTQLGVVISDVLDGVDVPRRLRDQQRQLAGNYQRMLASEVDRYQGSKDSNRHP